MIIEILGTENLRLHPQNDADIALIDYWDKKCFEFEEGSVEDKDEDCGCKKVGYIQMITKKK